MVLRKELAEYIKRTGLKKSFVANELNISGSKLSQYLHGKLLITKDIDNKVKEYLKKSI